MKKWNNHIVSFLVPVAVLLVIYACWGQWPFGDKTLLYWDMDAQYSAFFVHLHDILHGKASPMYSFARAFGGDMLGVSAYYLISPFNLIFYFFDRDTVYIGVWLLMLLKTGTIGLSMFCYLDSRRREAGNLLFSTAYALCGYVIGYGFCVMWLDGVMLLPLVVWGIENLVEERRFLLYSVSIGLGILTNFYIGYMLCAFSVIYFIVYFFLLSEGKKRVATVFLYIASSLAGGMLSACIAIPSLHAMAGNKNAMDFSSIWNFHWVLDGRAFFSAGLSGMMAENQMWKPMAYSSLLAAVCMIAFFFLKGVAWKRKAAYAVLLSVLIASFGFENLNLAWHAFTVPGSPYRYAFVYSFVVTKIAAESYGILSGRAETAWRKKWELPAAAALVLAVIVALWQYFSMGGTRRTVLVNIALLLAIVAVSVFVKEKRIRFASCLAFLCAELVFTAVAFYRNSELYEPKTVLAYKEFLREIEPLADHAGAGGEEFYRTVITPDVGWSLNDSYLFNLYGLDSYTSLEQHSTQDMATDLGYYTNMIFGIHYKSGSTLTAESLLGVRYKITGEAEPVGYRLVESQNTAALYENEAAFPFAWLAGQEILSVKNEPYDTFAYQNAICRQIPGGNGAGQDVLRRMAVELVEMDGCILDAEGNYVAADADKEGKLLYRATADRSGMAYMQFLNLRFSEAVCTVDGEKVDFSEQASITKKLGFVTPESEILLQCVLKGEERLSEQTLALYVEDDALLREKAELAASAVQVVKHTESDIAITAENGGKEACYLVCTVPKYWGWKVTVDGELRDTSAVMGNLTAVMVEPGRHTVRLRYFSKGVKTGALVSVMGVLLLLFLGVVVRRGKMSRQNQPIK